MKFIEKHIRTILNGNDSPLAKHVLPVNIGNVATWYFEDSEVYESSIRDQFKCVVAPAPVTYLEYRIPTQWKVKDPKGNGWIIQKTPHAENEFVACLIVQEKLPVGFCGKNPAQGSVIGQLLSTVDDSKPVGFLQTTFFFAGNPVDCILACWAENYLDVDGRMLGGPVYNVHESLLRNNPNHDDAYSSLIRAYGYPVYFALNLLTTCDSISAVKEQLSDRDRRQAAKVKSVPFGYWNLRIDKLKHACGGRVEEALKNARTRANSCLFGMGADEAKIASDLKDFKFKVGK